MEDFAYEHLDNVKTEALRSRILLIILQYVANILFPDHNADVFHFTKTKQLYGMVDNVIFHIFDGFLRWDAQYFVHISIYGYTYEHCVAFFPFFPIFIGVVSKIFHYFFAFISIEALVLLFAIIFNIIIFICASRVLFKLTCLIFNDERLGHKVVLLFCYNPASIFFLAPYTECLYSFLTFQIILNCLTLYKNYEKSGFKLHFTDGWVLIQIALSAITRSNGVLNIGFIIFIFICLMKKTLPSKKFDKLPHILKYAGYIFFFSLLTLVPFMIYQLYCYQQFCTNFSTKMPKNVEEYGVHQKYILPGQFNKHNQTWCYNLIPLAYSYVQNHYWNVGFLRYYEFKQIPNFILATPLVVIVLKNSVVHLKRNLGKNISTIFTFRTFSNHGNLTIDIFNPVLNVFVIHAFFLVIFCVLFIHVQVTTRMLCSASPILYWYCSQYLVDLPIKETYISFFKSFNSLSQLLIKIYFLGYFVLGTILFSNFLPWT